MLYRSSLLKLLSSIKQLKINHLFYVVAMYPYVVAQKEDILNDFFTSSRNRNELF